MTPPADGVSTSRPVILGTISALRAIRPRSGGSSRVHFLNDSERVDRIDLRFEETAAAFGAQVQLAESIQAADPQLVLVFEALDEQIDLTAVAQKLGLEILVESEGAMEPTDEYQLISENPRNPFIGSCLHAVCLNQSALNDLLSLWGAWKRNQSLPYGYSPLRELFAHLKDLRPWGPPDRLKMLDWDEHFADRITDQPHAIEIELWYRRSPQTRLASQGEVTALVEQAGGQVHASAVIEQIGYHGLKCTVPPTSCWLSHAATSVPCKSSAPPPSCIYGSPVKGSRSSAHPSTPCQARTARSPPPSRSCVSSMVCLSRTIRCCEAGSSSTTLTTSSATRRSMN